MSSSGSPNPFEGMPFFGDLAKLFGQGTGVPWDTARSLALAVATNGESEPNVDPSERMKLEQLARVAELHVARVTGLETAVGGHEVQVMPVNRALWATKSLEAFRPLLEKLSTSLAPGGPEGTGQPGTGTHPTGSDPLASPPGFGFTGGSPEGGPPDIPPPGVDPADPDAPGDFDDQMAAMIAPMLRAMQPTMVAMTSGSMIGHLAQRCFGQYDLPIPRPEGNHEILVVMPNLDAFAEEWSLPADDLRLWVCLHEISYHTVLGVPHVRAELDDLVQTYVANFRNDPQALQDQLKGLAEPDELDPTGANLMQQIQQVLGEPGALLGAIESDEQRAIRPRLEALMAVLTGVVDHVMDQVGGSLIGSYGMMTEALRRRRVQTAEADRFVERLFGLELTQATYDRGANFVAGVLERAGDEGLARLWESAEMLPRPPEVDAPGLWLARIDLPHDEG